MLLSPVQVPDAPLALELESHLATHKESLQAGTFPSVLKLGSFTELSPFHSLSPNLYRTRDRACLTADQCTADAGVIQGSKCFM